MQRRFISACLVAATLTEAVTTRERVKRMVAEQFDQHVLGKTPDDVCNVIVGHMGDAVNTGGVVVLCGLSGTGKGTTVARLGELLPEGKTTGWSNGNVFRSLTLLAATWCEQQGLAEFDGAKALTPENLATFMGMLTFDKFDGAWDIKISGLGIEAMVSAIKNTDLKGPKV